MDSYRTIQQQFELEGDNNKDIKIMVFNNPSNGCYINYIYKGQIIPIKYEENELLEDICKKFASNINKEMSSIYFLYDGDVVDSNHMNKKIKEIILNNMDIKNEIFTILVQDVEENNENPECSLSNNNDDFIDEKKDSIQKNSSTKSDSFLKLIDEENKKTENKSDEIHINDNNLKSIKYSEKKIFHLKTFLILLIQYFFITLLIWLGFFFKINEILINSKEVIIILSISITFIIIVISYIFINFLRDNIYLIIYNIFYVIVIAFFCLVLSNYIKENIIFCSFCLIVIEIIGLETYSLLFNNYKIYFFGICSFMLYLIGIIPFYFFWIKDIETMLYISIIPIFMILYHIIIIFIFEKIKFCELNEIFYATTIFNYGISVLFALILKKLFSFFKICIIHYISYNYNEDIKYFIRLFFNLIIQFILIISIVWIGFATGLHEYIIEDTTNMIWIFIIMTIIIFIMTCILARFYDSTTTSPFWHIYQTLYVPFMIIYIILLSKYIEEKYILCVLFIYFFDLISIEIAFILFNSYKFFGVFSVIMNAISIFLFSYFWLKDYSVLTPLSIISVLIILYLCIFSYIVYNLINVKEVSFGVAILNYGIFGIIFTLIFGLFALIGLLIYLIVQCMK